MNTTSNVILMTAGAALVSAGTAAIGVHFLSGVVEIFLGTGLFVIYHFLP